MVGDQGYCVHMLKLCLCLHRPSGDNFHKLVALLDDAEWPAAVFNRGHRTLQPLTPPSSKW